MTLHRIIDAHHHLWDLNHCHYPWLMAKGMNRFFGDPTPIQKNYLPENFLTDTAAFDLAGSVHIQVGVAEEDSVKETRWLQNLSSEAPHLPSAIVGYADLTDPNLEVHLNNHANMQKFKGVRQIIGRHPSEDASTRTADLLSHKRFLPSLKLLAQQGLSFDLQLTEPQYAKAHEVFAQVPDLNVVICHFASPWDLSRDGFDRWSAAITNFANLPNCHLKFSGFGMFKNDWSTEDIKPFVLKALELFGPERLMTGANFPVDKLYGGYDRIWRALEVLAPDTKTFRQLTFNSAASFYNIRIKDGEAPHN